MKTLVAYASKYGTTEKCAKEVGSKLKDKVDFLDLKQTKDADLSEYEKVIIGCSINVGKIQPEAKKFIERHNNELKSKKLGVFICCGAEGEEAQKELMDNFPEELLRHATAKDYFGGEIKLSKMPKFVQFMVKRMAKTDIDKEMLLPERINNFILQMNEV